MDYVALKALILSIPEAATLFAEGRDADVANLLSVKTEAGNIPARHFGVTLAAFPAFDGLRRWVIDSRTMPAEYGGGVCPFALYCLFQNLTRVDDSIEWPIPLRSFHDDVEATINAALLEQQAASAFIPSGFKDFLLDGDEKRSVAEVQFGRDVTSDDVSKARVL